MLSRHQLQGFVRRRARHQRRARTAASEKPRIGDMLMARPLHAFVRPMVSIQITNARLILTWDANAYDKQNAIRNSDHRKLPPNETPIPCCEFLNRLMLLLQC